MKKNLFQKFIYSFLAVSTFVFFFVLTFPHQHEEEKPFSNQNHSCLVCKIQSNFGSEEALQTQAMPLAAQTVFEISFLSDILLFSSLISLPDSRAPPSQL
jgi:hypothetical protein